MSKDHLIRMAGRIHRHLSSQSTSTQSEWQYAANELFARLRSLEGHLRLARHAHHRRWHTAVAAEEREVLAEAARIEVAAAHLINRPMQPSGQSNAPTLRTIVEDLKQLQDEFEEVEIDLKQGLFGVTTAPIVLEDINLGPFSIELHVRRLADRLDSDCFNCIALEPNPAGSSESTVHPHVQDGRLCAGDATLPISAALKEGRIADAFVLIRSVLQNYNSDSPYVALENWSGVRCADCDYVTDGESMYFCDDCERDVCEECYSSCDMCSDGCCRNCLETDNVSGNRCCSACRHTCQGCDRTVDEENFDEETGLCPGCLEQQKQEQENEHEHESESVNAAASAADAATPTVATPAAA